MSSLNFEGRRVAFREGDTVASALYRDGVRTFTRSLKYHRRRGLYCGTGDCPNCLITVDGIPGVRSCTVPCVEDMSVSRESGWPSTEHDAMRITDRLRPLMPVGFYYKTFIKPRFAWEVAEKVIRRATGLGQLPVGAASERRTARHVHTHVLVVGAGEAGLRAALDAAAEGSDVVLCDEGSIGAAIAPGAALDRVRAMEAEVRATDRILLLEDHVAVGIYEGPTVPLLGALEQVQVHPASIVVATGATETHAVFPGNDLPGVWLGRGAARMAGVHGVPPGRTAVVAASTLEGLEHLETLQRAGMRIAAAAVPVALIDDVPDGVEETIQDGAIHEAFGRGRVEGVSIRRGDRVKRFACDTLVLSLGLSPRDALARMAVDEAVTLIGDAATPSEPPVVAADGYVCLCEDVSLHDLEDAWQEGFRSSEILKRYTTTTMGPCQGAVCGRALACFARERAGEPVDVPRAGARTTARPPARPATLATLAAGVHETIEKRTSLHAVHVALGARMDWSGGWKRPFTYGEWREGYRAVRERVSLMDLGTLGKFLVAGPDALTLVDRLFPCRVRDLAPGGSRYLVALDEAGYVMDDGLLCALEDGVFYLNSTSGGAGRMDARLREWTDLLDLRVHVLDQTSQLGAILVGGPRARELLSRLSDDPIDAEAFPYPGHRQITVAGIACLAIRTGFVGELAFELHHPRRSGVELWQALMHAGTDMGIEPHGLDALELLRLEKGHRYLGQDTLPDDTPQKLGLGWAVDPAKEWFVGKLALERIAALPPTRVSRGFVFDGAPEDVSELRGQPLTVAGRVVGRITSAERSDVVGAAIGLGWIRASDGGFPTELDAGSVRARVVPTPFFDPEGVRLRG